MVEAFKKRCFFQTLFLLFTFLLTADAIAKDLDQTPEERICPLCNCGKLLEENHKKLYGRDLEGTNILFSSKSFYVSIDNYPVCHNHLLIVPKEHSFSYSVLDLDLRYEFEAIIRTLCEVIGTENYGLFEHGSNMVGEKQKACGNSIYHAHMHFIPNLNLSLEKLTALCSEAKKGYSISLKSGYELRSFCKKKFPDQDFISYIKELPTKGPYLFCYYSNLKKEAVCVPDQIIEDGVPSQFFRRVMAEHFQKGEENIFWDWKKFVDLQKSNEFRKNVVKKTIEKFENREKVFRLFKKNLYLILLSKDADFSGDFEMLGQCFFCNHKSKIVLDGNLAFVVEDNFPVTRYHSLIVPKRHFDSYFDITEEELLEIHSLIKLRKEQILSLDKTVTGFNIGLNIGHDAGQSVLHMHVHLIPRRNGDLKNPKGGVRGVIPEKMNY